MSRRRNRRKVNPEVKETRAAIHAAMHRAERMRLSKKRGTSRIRDRNMEFLGFERIGPDGEGLPIERKWQKVSV